MSREFGRELEEHIMEKHWELVEQKPYQLFKGIWEKRHVLPETQRADFGKKLGEPLEIPLVGGGYIKLGVTKAASPELSVDLKFPTAKGEMVEDSFIVTSLDEEGDPFPFSIYYDGEADDERMKFLARMKPEKDIDWGKLKPDTAELVIALSMFKYRDSRPLAKVS